MIFPPYHNLRPSRTISFSWILPSLTIPDYTMFSNITLLILLALCFFLGIRLKYFDNETTSEEPLGIATSYGTKQSGEQATCPAVVKNDSVTVPFALWEAYACSTKPNNFNIIRQNTNGLPKVDNSADWIQQHKQQPFYWVYTNKRKNYPLQNKIAI